MHYSDTTVIEMVGAVLTNAESAARRAAADPGDAACIAGESAESGQVSFATLERDAPAQEN